QQSVMDSTSRTPSERSRLYKNKDKDGEELRRRRNDASVELRKASKTDQMMKRRNIDLAAGDDDEDVALGDGQQQASGKVLSPLRDANNVLANASIDDICKAMKSGSPADQFAAIQACRRALSKERHPPIDEFVNRGVLPELVVALTKPANHQVVFEAAWALTNIASALIELLNSEHLNVAEQAVWALGNIAGDGSELRDRAIKAGIVQPLLRLLQRVSRDSAIAASSSSSGSDNSVSLLGNCAWLVSNLCRNKNPPPPASAVLELLPAMAALLQAPHKEVVQDTCWALSYVTDAVNDLIGQ
uniref:IBB domain-containing protein n=1 Tax=Macrostomum lignano TaxID=282301 RepID=A0A1I8IJ76_9PLAT